MYFYKTGNNWYIGSTRKIVPASAYSIEKIDNTHCNLLPIQGSTLEAFLNVDITTIIKNDADATYTAFADLITATSDFFLKAPAIDISTYQTKIDNTLATIDKTIVGAIGEVRAIALGIQPSYVFDTKVAMDLWLTIPANVAILQVGNNLLIRQLTVPDYWWDGTQALELEVKIDLTNYYNKTEIDNLLVITNKQALINSLIF